jgi:hypothetical protein
MKDTQNPILTMNKHDYFENSLSSNNVTIDRAMPNHKFKNQDTLRAPSQNLNMGRDSDQEDNKSNEEAQEEQPKDFES